MSLRTTEFTLAADVANGADLSLAYPAGTNQAFFTGTNASATGVVIINDNDVYTEVDEDIAITYAASDIDITNDSGQTWLAGSRVLVQLSYFGEEDDLAAYNVSASAQEINQVADLSARQREVTATADGLTTGALTTADFNGWLNVASGNANHIVKLPAAGAAFIGGTIEMWVGANGCELRCDGAACTINGLDCKTVNEAAVPATHRVRATLVAAETWLLEGDTELGARATIVPDAV